MVDATHVLRMDNTQIGKLTEKLKELSKQLMSEKTSAEKNQKSKTDQMQQQTTENRKLALEISKLKVIALAVNCFITCIYHATVFRLS